MTVGAGGRWAPRARRVVRPSGRVAGAALLLAATFPAPSHGLQAAAASPALAPPEGAVETLVVGERPWIPAVTVTRRFPGGSGEDPEGSEGAAWLLGMVLAETAERELSGLGARVEIEVEPLWTTVTLFATPDAWETAHRTLGRILFDDDIDGTALLAARQDLLAQLAFQRGAPVRSVELETWRLLLGAFHPAARSPTGTAESVGTVGTGALSAMKARVFRPEAASVAVVGPVTVERVASVVGARRVLSAGPGGEEGWAPGDTANVATPSAPAQMTGDAGAGGGAATDPPPEADSTSAPREPAWLEGERYSISDDVTNTWIAAAYPLSPDFPRTDVEFLGHALQRELAPNPPPPGLFHASVEVRDLPGGPVLLVLTAVESRSAARWERRMSETVGRLGAAPLRPLFFHQHRRSFRSLTAIRLTAPEAEGRRLLDDVARLGSPRDIAAEIARLDAERLRRAATTLGQPRVLVFGPGRG